MENLVFVIVRLLFESNFRILVVLMVFFGYRLFCFGGLVCLDFVYVEVYEWVSNGMLVLVIRC